MSAILVVLPPFWFPDSLYDSSAAALFRFAVTLQICDRKDVLNTSDFSNIIFYRSVCCFTEDSSPLCMNSYKLNILFSIQCQPFLFNLKN
jgi:hypothetical protein